MSRELLSARRHSTDCTVLYSVRGFSPGHDRLQAAAQIEEGQEDFVYHAGKGGSLTRYDRDS